MCLILLGPTTPICRVLLVLRHGFTGRQAFAEFEAEAIWEVDNISCCLGSAVSQFCIEFVILSAFSINQQPFNFWSAVTDPYPCCFV